MTSNQWIMRTVNEDLKREREKCNFNPMELTNLLDGSPEDTEKRQRLEDFFLNDERLKDNTPTEYLSYEEVYQTAVRKGCIVISKVKELVGPESRDMKRVISMISKTLGSSVAKDGNPLVVHWIMFIPTIIGQGTEEQITKWLPRAWNCNILGTYAQTELGHGTFLRGLETTATYDHNTQEFILNSPTLTSYKWWPGGLGHTANYALIPAQLYTQGKHRGVHIFMVQLRDEDTHEHLPGIKTGDIGSKMSMNGVNNGFLSFHHVRIPRENMLMKNSKVLEDGTYIKASNDKLTYGAMLFTRVLMVTSSFKFLSKAVVIATRYSIVRKQGRIHPNGPEVQVIDYVTQQYKLFPQLASCFAFHWSAQWISNMYEKVSDEFNQGDFNRLPELHAISCCLKAVTTYDTAQGIDELRRSCGGHGYMLASCLPSLYGSATAACTYEGENTVLYLQAARFLVKACQRAVEGKDLPPTVKYLETLRIGHGKTAWRNNYACYVTAHEQVASRKLKLAIDNLSQRIGNGISPEDAWNESSIELVLAAESHCRLFLVSSFIEAIKSYEGKVSKPLYESLNQLCELYALYWILQRLGDFLQYSNLSKSDVPQLQRRLEECLAAIRPNAIGVVDGLDIRDEVLDSALGAYDGDVYQRLFDRAMKSPLNRDSVNESYHKYIKPFLKSGL